MATFGNTSSSYSRWENADVNVKRAGRFLCGASGNVSTVKLYCDCDTGGAGIWKAVIYADSAGTPAALLGTSAEVTTAKGSSKAWRTATFSSPVSVTAGLNYWIGFISGSGYLNYGRATGGTGVYNSDTYSNGATDPFGAYTAMASPEKLTIFAEILPANSAPNAPTLVSPIGGVTITGDLAQTFKWAFSDPNSGDTQSAYTLRYQLVGAGSWTTLSQVSSPVSQHTFAGGTFAAGDYEWQCKNRDQLGVEGPYSSSGTFTSIATPDTPVVTAPAVDETIDAASYTVTWSVPTQESYQCRVVADDGGVPDTDTVEEDTGTVSEADTREVLMPFETNNVTQHVQLRVYDSTWSEWASVRVDIAFTPPDTPTLVLTAVSSEGKITVDVTVPDSDGGEPDAVWFDVYRATDSEGTDAIRIHMEEPLAMDNGVATGSWDDYGCAADVDYYYKVIVYTATRANASSTWT